MNSISEENLRSMKIAVAEIKSSSSRSWTSRISHQMTLKMTNHFSEMGSDSIQLTRLRLVWP